MELRMSSVAEEGLTGILTKTIVDSPVVKWILHARIRHKHCNDVVYIGDNFIQVKQVKEPGQLDHVAYKNDFDCRICAAKTFDNVVENDEDDLLIKIEQEGAEDQSIPPQSIILTTDTNDVLFLHLLRQKDGEWQFAHQACPMPTFDRKLLQPGEHLAVDPFSRALAVAANEREVIIYSAKSKEMIQHEIRSSCPEWCPIAAQRPLQVDGIVQHIDFLYPPIDSTGTHDEDLIILLLIIVSDGMVRAEWIEWHLSSDLHHAVLHRGQPLDEANSVPNLLIPLRNAAFILTNGIDMIKWKDMLCGAASPESLCKAGDILEQPAYPGASPRRPIWASWCRPVRGSAAKNDTESLYLVLEDGRVYLFQIGPRGCQRSHAGDFDCHAGSAFASLGSSRDPDVLAIAGDMSTGSVHSIGSWFSPLRLRESTRERIMDMELIETWPNWASVTDMVTTKLPGRSHRTRDSIFVTSGRQPYGTISELRHGLQARISVYFELDGLHSVTGIWTLPLTSSKQILVLLSSPTGTRMLAADAELEDIEEVDSEKIALESGDTTLAAASTPDGKIVQVTSKAISVSPGTSANFEDCARKHCEDHTTIAAAAIDSTRGWVITVEKSQADSSVACYRLQTNEVDLSGEDQVERTHMHELSGEPLALSIIVEAETTLIFVAKADGVVVTFSLSLEGMMKELGTRNVRSQRSNTGICDSIVVLRTPTATRPASTALLVVCGLRDGSMFSFKTSFARPDEVVGERVIDFGQNNVKLTRHWDDLSAAYAMSGTDTCLLSWAGDDVSSLAIQNIWISDKLRPELPQGVVSACTHMPSAHLLAARALANSLVMISEDEFLVTTLERISSTVPRQIPVAGTPSRLIYAQQQRCLVAASMRFDTKRTSPMEGTRQIWPCIDFVPSRADASSFTYEMQPGERVYALLEWSFKQPAEDKTYSFILAGGSYTRSNGSVRGRIAFLQPSVNRAWEVVGVNEGRNLSFEAPVYSVGLLDSLTIIICTGRSVVAFGFSEEARKWIQLCSPVQITSPGIYITVEGGVAQISTNADSLVMATLVKREEVDVLAGGDQYDRALRITTIGPRADSLLSHAVLSSPGIENSDTRLTTALMTTKYGQVVGLRHDGSKRVNGADLLFEAQLPRSLTRIRRCNIRPRWKPQFPRGVLDGGLIGCAADGTLVGIALLDKELWRRLSWVQRLCEWSKEISPHSWQAPAYTVSESTYARDERAMPVGMSGNSTPQDTVMKTNRPRLHDGHIDGDVLARVMEGGTQAAMARLERVMREIAGRQDRVGGWMCAHLETELGAVEEMVLLLQALLDSWI